MHVLYVFWVGGWFGDVFRRSSRQHIWARHPQTTREVTMCYDCKTISTTLSDLNAMLARLIISSCRSQHRLFAAAPARRMPSWRSWVSRGNKGVLKLGHKKRHQINATYALAEVWSRLSSI
jgi:hypothetical protein